jgi:hypothetical protein
MHDGTHACCMQRLAICLQHKDICPVDAACSGQHIPLSALCMHPTAVELIYRGLVIFQTSVGSAPACYKSSLGSNPETIQKYKMGDISKRVANTI